MAVAVNLQDVLEYNYFAGIVKMEEKGSATDAEIKKWSTMEPATITEKWISKLGRSYIKEGDSEKKENIKNVIDKIYNNDMLNAEDLNILAG